MNIKNIFKKKQDSVPESTFDYELYEKELRAAQEEELHSSRYEFVTVFMNMINSRKFRDKENYLFQVILNDRNRHLSRDYNKVKEESLEFYNALIKFVQELTEDEINDNYYFYVIKNLLDTSSMDVFSPISDLKKLIAEKSRLGIFRRHYKLNDGINELIPKVVPLTKEHSIETNSVFYSRTDSILDVDHIALYRDYNFVIDKLKEMIENVYALVIWNELSKLEEPIGLRTIRVGFVDDIFDIDLCFALESNNRVKRSYIIDKRITMLIGEACGIPFDDMVVMDPRVLKEKLQQMEEKRLIKK